MKRKHILMGMFALSAVMLLGSCANNNGDNPSQNSSSQTTETSLQFQTVVLSQEENVPGKLNVKASKKGEKGTIYYGITKTEAEYTAAQIVTPDTNTFVQSGHSDTSIDTSYTLEAGVTYYGYFVIKDGDDYSQVVKRSATTFILATNMGTGTEEDPFKISTIEDLEMIGAGEYEKYNLNFKASAHYVLTKDIDLSEKYGADKNKSWTPLPSFSGVFDGDGHKISNLYINIPEFSNPEKGGYAGLFNDINASGVVKNVTLVDAVVKSMGSQEDARTVNGDGSPTSNKATVTGYTTATSINVGTLAGYVKGVVENCHVKHATVNVDGSRGGGLTGRIYSTDNTATKVRNCSVTETTITGCGRLGGIAGLVDAQDKKTYTQAIIENCTFQGTITGTNINLVNKSDTANPDKVLGIVCAEYIGGIAGYYRTTIMKNVVADATITGYRHIGGIVGFQQRNSTEKAGTNYTVIDGAISKVELHLPQGTNMGPIVGNKSIKYTSADKGSNEEVSPEVAVPTTNVYFLDSSKFFSGTTEKQYEDLPATAKIGERVAADALTAAWYETNLKSFDFTNVFKLDETTKLPVLK